MNNAAAPAAMTSADAPRSALRPRRWLGLIFWAGMVALLAWLWPRSHHTADLLAAFTRSGNVQGVLSHRGQLLVGVSTLSLGPDKALTAEHVSAPPEDGDWLYADVFAGASTTRQKWGFGYAVSRKGDLPSMPDVTWSAVTFPHGAALAACSLMTLWHLWRFVLRRRERRWHRQGRCTACGYDLWGTPSDRCPECGTPVLPATASLPATGQAKAVAAGVAPIT